MQENLYQKISEPLSEELTQILCRTGNVRIERIVSRGHTSAAGFWYDQAEEEWVAVLQGTGTIELKDPVETITLKAGDHLLIPAHRKHRVIATSATEDTLWLAVFIQNDGANIKSSETQSPS